MIDEIALYRYGLAACLHVPIAAVDETAVTTYVGDVLQAVGGQRRALLVARVGRRRPTRAFRSGP
ncbi:hypothetical protein [Brevundimonas variabilis]|uniref:Uncharacterized protein n=1 Tax=Brevundimonas variabilis TaxID=74312 RepID=A0A7W9CK06_9CAUL|nr:hypothetical protein [Brevundimonas variabilis]MBB5747037.1 hypothetical protein [Brevundimonas variabilis]